MSSRANAIRVGLVAAALGALGGATLVASLVAGSLHERMPGPIDAWRHALREYSSGSNAGTILMFGMFMGAGFGALVLGGVGAFIGWIVGRPEGGRSEGPSRQPGPGKH